MSHLRPTDVEWQARFLRECWERSPNRDARKSSNLGWPFAKSLTYLKSIIAVLLLFHPSSLLVCSWQLHRHMWFLDECLHPLSPQASLPVCLVWCLVPEYLTNCSYSINSVGMNDWTNGMKWHQDRKFLSLKNSTCLYLLRVSWSVIWYVCHWERGAVCMCRYSHTHPNGGADILWGEQMLTLFRSVSLIWLWAQFTDLSWRDAWYSESVTDSGHQACLCYHFPQVLLIPGSSSSWASAFLWAFTSVPSMGNTLPCAAALFFRLKCQLLQDVSPQELLWHLCHQNVLSLLWWMPWKVFPSTLLECGLLE